MGNDGCANGGFDDEVYELEFLSHPAGAVHLYSAMRGPRATCGVDIWLKKIYIR